MADDSPRRSVPGDSSRSPRDRLRAVGDRVRSTDRTLLGLLAIVALSLAVRIVGLGTRVAQWDEGRVAYWVLRYQETGAWEYRPIVHGPFLYHVDRLVFSVFGANDFTMRLVVALIGGLLPLAAWLFREHLRDSETIALGLLFASNPLLIYYSRFFRNDVLLATFMVFAFGLFVRTYDTREPRYLYAGAACLALGFTTKENALVYPACWLGAAALLLDHRLFRVGERARRAGRAVRSRAAERAPTVADGSGSDDEPPVAEGGDRVGTTATDGPDGEADPADYLLDRIRPRVGRLDVLPAVAVVLLNPYVLSFVGDVLTALLDAVVGLAVGGPGPAIGYVPLVPVGLAAGGLALVAALNRPDSPGTYVGVIVSYAAAFGLWGFGAGPDVTTVTHVLVYGLWLALLADAALFDRDEALSGSVPASYALFFAVVVFFYAPRAGGGGGLGLYAAATAPGTAPAVLHEAVIGSWEKFLTTWGASSHQEHPYLPFFVDYVERLQSVAAVTVSAAVLGFVYDRYAAEGPRDLVSAAAYWGGASVLGYPLITDIMAPWAVVHAIVPLAIPAAVGLALVYRWARDIGLDEPVQATVSVVLVVLVVGWTAGVAYDANVAAPDRERNEAFAHWTQPDNDLKHSLRKIERVSAENEGTDVLFYGSRKSGSRDTLFYVSNESLNDDPPAPGGWYDRLPLPWYLERYDANVTSTPLEGNPGEKLDDPPPVVITYSWDRNEVTPYLDGYVMYRHGFKLWGEDILVFVHADHLDSVGSGQSVGANDPAPATDDTIVDR